MTVDNKDKSPLWYITVWWGVEKSWGGKALQYSYWTITGTILLNVVPLVV